MTNSRKFLTILGGAAAAGPLTGVAEPSHEGLS
jgi:hypothetical protein